MWFMMSLIKIFISLPLCCLQTSDYELNYSVVHDSRLSSHGMFCSHDLNKVATSKKAEKKKFQSIQHFERFKYLHISWNNNVRFRLSHNFSFFYLSEMFIYSVHTRKEICFASAPIVSECEPNEINVIVNRTKIIDEIVSWEMSALRRNQIDIFKT